MVCHVQTSAIPEFVKTLVCADAVLRASDRPVEDHALYQLGMGGGKGGREGGTEPAFRAESRSLIISRPHHPGAKFPSQLQGLYRRDHSD